MQNGTEHDVMLAGKTILGTVQSVKSVFPITAEESTVTVSTVQPLVEGVDGGCTNDPVDVSQESPSMHHTKRPRAYCPYLHICSETRCGPRQAVGQHRGEKVTVGTLTRGLFILKKIGRAHV